MVLRATFKYDVLQLKY